MWGLTKALETETGKTLAGVGFWTLDGFVHRPDNEPQRYWYNDICVLNARYGLRCDGECCTPRHSPNLEESF